MTTESTTQTTASTDPSAQAQDPQTSGSGLSTADLAGTSSAASTDAGDTQVETRSTGADDSAPLFDESDAQSFRDRWTSIQAGFVDDPQDAVKQADGLVAETIKRLAQVFADERDKLESQWSSGGDVDTEALRVALQRYRSFFDRLLSV